MTSLQEFMQDYDKRAPVQETGLVARLRGIADGWLRDADAWDGQAALQHEDGDEFQAGRSQGFADALRATARVLRDRLEGM